MVVVGVVVISLFHYTIKFQAVKIIPPQRFFAPRGRNDKARLNLALLFVGYLRHIVGGGKDGGKSRLTGGHQSVGKNRILEAILLPD